VQKDEWALIIGAGPIGLSIMPFAKAAGAKLIVADVSESRLRFCNEQFKIEHVIDGRGDLTRELGEITNGEFPTLIMDATGNDQSMARTFDLLASGGRIVFVGLFQGDVSFNDPNFHRREITLLATRNSTAADFKRIIAMIEAGEINTTPWVTHRASCDALVDTLPSWLAPDAGLIKAIVEF
jgi:2-desacetyl-2-hydroxyethyl bacteriochlorophyllide A dehydrogenase